MVSFTFYRLSARSRNVTSIREMRLHALGHTDAGRLLHISFTLRGDGRLIRVISARSMHRRKRLRYEQEA